MHSLNKVLIFMAALSVRIQQYACFSVDSYHAENRLLQVAVDPVSGTVFLGGQNVLLQMTENLQLIESLTLGPKVDSLDCDPSLGCVNGALTENYVKVLEVHLLKQKLLVCGTVHQGSCSLHSLANISNFQDITNTSVSNFLGSRKSVVVHISNFSNQLGCLIVGQEYDGRNANFSPNVFSVRKIESPAGKNSINFFHYDEAASTISALDIPSSQKSTYHMEFVNIFHDDEFIYFLTVQQKSLSSPGEPYPRLSRICNNDTAFFSYVEIGLLCKFDGKEYLKILTAVQHDEMLFFTAARTSEEQPFEAKTAFGSVVCGIRKSDIRNFYFTVNTNCYGSGIGVQLSSWFSGKEDQKCSPKQVTTYLHKVKFHLLLQYKETVLLMKN